ncbi:MAG: histidine phosphatase family protein [Leuconostoc mesenteroides]|uniref:histidine phosphatase family protein n=1 Tax=Leuconostoc mesenteroides TaxID=1245 RepID=UPI0012398704|nr:histidine phosphatase family protein [Leuconostoc mesenteroides]MDN6080523.1 histidine phosphatase family protein [Leuconostoc sp.]KAA8368677.1 histidine phosphatase family protein [Leuconostoc mesenteroides]MBZ1508098.1 histidine phosphatase family protein [Leuconostoc mesenteroides]MBZ1511612.1 histidine phosphatase family protein [Leuconostoc mesenteroides]MBZ1528424.1 histidine phosphatase family protein [Leuconostoc mesenteroides]
MKLYVVRHGQTIFNTLNKVQGWADTPLTKKGEKDGQEAGKRLKNVAFDVAFSSDTSRAMHTAEYILAENIHEHTKLQITPEWREYFFGSFEGGSNDVMWGAVAKEFGVNKGTPDAIAAEVQDMTAIMNKIYEVDPEHLGENATRFWQRIDAALEKLLMTQKANANVLLVTHGQLIGNLAQHYGHFLGAERPKNGAVAVFNLDDDGLQVEFFNDVNTVF